MAWFESADGRVRFRGRITREPIREWLATEAGAAAVDEAARRTRFSLLGRRRAARQQLTRALGDAISGSRVRETVAAECEGYLAAWTPLAYAPSLPRLSIAYRRLVVVPRVMILWRVASRSAARVAASLPDAGVPDSFRTFFSQWVVAGVDQAVRRATPSPHAPIARTGILDLRRLRWRHDLGRYVTIGSRVAGPRRDVRDALAEIAASRAPGARSGDCAAHRIAPEPDLGAARQDRPRRDGSVVGGGRLRKAAPRTPVPFPSAQMIAAAVLSAATG